MARNRAQKDTSYIMEIMWLGNGYFRLRSREGTVVTDPTPRKTSSGSSRTTADVVTISHGPASPNDVSGLGGQPKVLTGPGEYEVKGINVIGIRTYRDDEKGKKRGKNTAYLVEMDDLVVCHLGDLGHILTTDQVDEIGENVDVLLIPVGGGSTLDAAQAVEVISLLEPRVVIPMRYQVGDLDAELDTVDKFLREFGQTDVEAQPKATVGKSNLPESTQVIVLEPRAS